MYEAFLVPEITIEAAGESEPVALGGGAGKALLLTLAITGIVEQESLDVSIWGSADGAEWGAKPLMLMGHLVKNPGDVMKLPHLQY